MVAESVVEVLALATHLAYRSLPQLVTPQFVTLYHLTHLHAPACPSQVV